MDTPFLIDCHAHLDDPILAHDLDAVVRHARDAGVWVVTVGSDLASSKKAVAIAETYGDGVFAAVGVHPLRAPTDRLSQGGLHLGEFRELLRHPKTVAVGEVGLDYSRLPSGRLSAKQRTEVEAYKSRQKALLSAFLEISRETQLPLFLHCRDAHADLLEMLANWEKLTPGFADRGVIHCFSGTTAEAKRYFGLDFLISVTGLMGHGAHNLAVTQGAPLDRLVIESDCPFAIRATPSGARRAEPSYLPTSLGAVAGLRGMKAADLAAAATANTLRVLKKIG
jgi:TatD DNase family protein